MILKEIKKDLFTMSDDYYLAHCIAEDLRMGAGIAVEFQKRFKLREKIREFPHKYPTCVLIGRVFNLITKKRSVDKPTYDTLHKALLIMKTQLIEYNVTKLAMPRIGCGLDRLSWSLVKRQIISIFDEVNNLEIIICNL